MCPLEFSPLLQGLTELISASSHDTGCYVPLKDKLLCPPPPLFTYLARNLTGDDACGPGGLHGPGGRGGLGGPGGAGDGRGVGGGVCGGGVHCQGRVGVGGVLLEGHALIVGHRGDN